MHKNMRVVANYCEFDDTGLIVGLKPPMIHMYNKVGIGFSVPVKQYKLGYLYWMILGS
jgi:hypothetical protein